MATVCSIKSKIEMSAKGGYDKTKPNRLPWKKATEQHNAANHVYGDRGPKKDSPEKQHPDKLTVATSRRASPTMVGST